MTMMKESAASIRVFQGIAGARAGLAGSGVQLAVVSSNSEHNVRLVLGPELSPLISLVRLAG
jgi:phosphoglycolate phosphatase